MRQILALAFCLALGAASALAQTSTLVLEFGHPDAEGDLTWNGSPSEVAAIRVVDQAPGASLDGSWVILMTRVRAASESITVPSWLAYTASDAAGVPATSIITSGVHAALGAETQARMLNRAVFAHPAMASLYLDISFLVPNSLASFGVAGTEGDGNQVPWRAMAPYWGQGFGYQIWAKTYQTSTAGVDCLNLQRVAEAAMETQAMNLAAVRNFLQSSAYATLIEEDGLQLELQAAVIRRMNPYDPPLVLPWYAFLPQGPLFGDDDCYLEFSLPVEILLPISTAEFAPGGNILVSSPGVVNTGSNPGDPIYFFAGNSLAVDTAIFPLLGGGTISAPILPIDPTFPDLGVYVGALPVATSQLNPNQQITLTRTATPIPNDVVEYRPIPNLEVILNN